MGLKLTTKDLFGDYDQLGYAEESGYVICKDHPELPLSLFVYDNSCVYNQMWTPVTKAARGLIVGPGHEVVALPFPKTFLVDVHLAAATDSEDAPKYVKPLPTGPFRVTTKVDGSLAIIYWFEGQWRVATKGSFASEHALWGQAYLADKDLGFLDRSLTYLAEMVIPEWGRIVVDNGDKPDMVLLGARSLYTGEYQRLASLVHGWAGIGSIVQSWGTETDPERLAARIKANQRPDGSKAGGTEFEGVVLQWEDGTIAKAKMQDYLNLHGLFTETTELGIWRVLSSGQGPESIMGNAPDEMVDWINSVVDDLESQKKELLEEVCREFMRVNRRAQDLAVPFFPERKDFAKATQGSKYQKVLFLLYDDDSDKMDNWLWKQVRPVGKTTYRKVEED